jgi:hypothetical protein
MDSFLILLIIAIPGFLTVALFRFLLLREEELTQFEFTILSASASLIIYLIVYGIEGTARDVDLIELLIYNNNEFVITSDFVIEITLLSLGLAILFAPLFSYIFIKCELIGHILKFFHDEEIIDEPVWDRTFKKFKGDMWIIVHTNSAEIYYGVAHRHSMKKEKRQLLLKHPAKFNKDGDLEYLDDSDEILFFEEDIRRIEILKSKKNVSKKNTKNTDDNSANKL